jgi:hypothetical protein
VDGNSSRDNACKNRCQTATTVLNLRIPARSIGGRRVLSVMPLCRVSRLPFRSHVDSLLLQLMQPKIHLRYSPGPTGFVSAMFYVEVEADVYGWYAEARQRRFSAAFFMLENFYAPHTPVLYRSVEDDVYGSWIQDTIVSGEQVRCPLPEPVRHELERIQSVFVQDWLFFENDPEAEPERRIYDERRLTLLAVNVKSRKLARLEKQGLALWEHSTPGSDPNVMDFLGKQWRVSGKGALKSHASAH